MGRIWALSVGIDAYDPLPLGGCINDVKAFADWLLNAMPGGTVEHRLLSDAAATRAAVMDGFASHLGKAGPGDVALFHYAGHGRRSTQATEFNQFDSSGKEEGLVLWDSQGPTGFDLADKELALLIDDVAKGGAEVVVILDCCHSGSATRDIDEFSGFRARFQPERAAAATIPYKRELADYAGGRYVEIARELGQPRIPLARHIALAACNRWQKAKERDGHGVFTTALLRVLKATDGRLSYAELFQKLRAAVRETVADQDPQCEAFGGFDGWTGFLGSTAARAPTRWNTQFRNGRWQVEAGAIHGLATIAGQPAVLRLFDGQTPVGTAQIVALGAQQSEIAPDFAADPTKNYAASALSLPAPALAVAADLPAEHRAALDAILAADAGIGVVLAAADASTRQRLYMADGAICLAHDDGAALWRVLPLPGWATAMAARLKALATWHRLITFDNPATRLDRGLVDVRLLSGGADGLQTVHPGPFVRIDIAQDHDSWQQPPVAVQLRNRSDQRLFACMLWFSPKLGIIKLDNRDIDPSEAWTIFWQVQKLFLDDTENEADFRFRLIIATEEIDDILLTQADIEWPEQPAPHDPTRITRAGMAPVAPQKLPLSNEFFCIDLGFTLVRQQALLGQQAATLGDGKITIEGHPTLTGQVALASPAQPTRALGRDGDDGNAVIAAAMAGAGLALATMGDSRSTDGGDGVVLDLSGISGQQGLAENPLVITARLPLGASERLLPLLFDGEDLLPPGLVETTDDGACRISLDSLPKPSTRSLGGAIKLYLFKTVLGKRDTNQLRRVDVSGPKPVYDGAGVTDAVAAANKVLLIIHGIIGETTSIAEGLIASGVGQDFDLVLAYDYENLGTPIATTAADLKRQLQAVGLSPDDGKHLAILAHSMGGLVSRAMIELSGGAGMVDHLVMCGTPNGGSPFGRIDQARHVVNLLVGLAGNWAPTMLPWTAPLVYGLNKSKVLTVTLEQMNPSSEFLATLSTARDPGVRYSVLAGSIDACTAAGDALPARLLIKLGQSTPLDLLFGGAPHDLATTLPSSKSVPAKRQPAIATGDALACHHLNYFSSPAGLAALKQVQW